MRPKPKANRFEDLAIGDATSFDVTITPEVVDAFADFSGDHNPLHTSDEYGASSRFGRRIPHGMIAGALFSRLVGMELPGLYATYVRQSLAFHKPLPFGAVTVRGVIREKSAATRTIEIETKIFGPDGAVLVQGEALVSVLQ
jgi:acyl dehydratase